MPNEMFTDAEVREQTTLAKPPASLNPFGSMAPANQASNASVAVAQSQAIAEIQGEMLIAKRMPRNQIEAMDRILNAFTRPSLAEKASYQYARGGTDISGASIRAAEAIAQQWGNIKCGVREIERRPGVSTMQAFAWDLETGFHDTKEFQVEHLRHTKRGSYKLEDPRDIYELTANEAARRKRACILAVIPGDVIERAMQQADITLKTTAEVTPETLQKLVDAFAEFAVTKAQIEVRIQRRLDVMTPAQLVGLRKIYNSLRDGMSSPVDWFEPTAGDGTQDPATVTPTRGAAGLKAAAAKVAPANESAKEDTGPVSFAGIAEAINKATSTDELDVAKDLMRSIPDEKQRAELDVEERAKRKALEK